MVVTQKVLLRCTRNHIVLMLCQFVFLIEAGETLFANPRLTVLSPNVRRAFGYVRVQIGINAIFLPAS